MLGLSIVRCRAFCCSDNYEQVHRWQRIRAHPLLANHTLAQRARSARKALPQLTSQNRFFLLFAMMSFPHSQHLIPSSLVAGLPSLPIPHGAWCFLCSCVVRSSKLPYSFCSESPSLWCTSKPSGTAPNFASHIATWRYVLTLFLQPLKYTRSDLRLESGYL